MPSANEELRDALLMHQIGLDRLSAGEYNKLLAILRRMERQIRELLRVRLAQIGIVEPGEVGFFTQQRLARLLKEIQIIRGTYFNEMRRVLESDLAELGKYETEFLSRLFRGAVPNEIPLALVLASERLIQSVVSSQPFQGHLLKTHFDRLASTNARAAVLLKQAIEEGILTGESSTQIVSRVLGQIRGPFRLTRANVQALVHTSVGHVTGAMRDQMGKDNSDLVKGFEWSSVFDLRTTVEYCLPRGGKLYTLDFQPINHSLPWGAGPGRIHWNCRSSSNMIMRSWEELGFEANELTPGTRASMNGQIPDDTTNVQFFERALRNPQHRARLQELHGHRLINAVDAGEISLDELALRTARANRRLTLDELGLWD